MGAKTIFWVVNGISLSKGKNHLNEKKWLKTGIVNTPFFPDTKKKFQ